MAPPVPAALVAATRSGGREGGTDGGGGRAGQGDPVAVKAAELGMTLPTDGKYLYLAQQALGAEGCALIFRGRKKALA